MLNVQLLSLAKKIIPRSLDLPLRYFYLKITRRVDQELSILRNKCPNCKRAIDIGTNIGIYSYGFAQFCEKIESFEPVINCTKMLRAYAEKEKKITVHNMGLSDHNGNATLFIPLIQGSTTLNVGLASFTDPGGSREALPIEIKRLDDYAFADVGIIKVDVEGHELEVLRGAEKTILREKPLLLVEIEQRHLKERTIEEVFSFITSLGYAGGYYQNGQYCPMAQFSYEKCQQPFLGNLYSNSYVNNFLFEPIYDK
jgi:FkbM family methyltransferase